MPKKMILKELVLKSFCLLLILVLLDGIVKNSKVINYFNLNVTTYVVMKIYLIFIFIKVQISTKAIGSEKTILICHFQ